MRTTDPTQNIDATGFLVSAENLVLDASVSAFTALPVLSTDVELAPVAIPGVVFGAAETLDTGGSRAAEPLLVPPGTTPVAAPRLYISDTVVDESSGFANVTVSMHAPGINTVTVSYVTGNATAAYGTGNDFTYQQGTLSFAPGETSKVIQVQLVDNATIEGIENFRVSLYSPTGGGVLAEDEGMITIVDNDAVVDAPEVFVRDVVVDEKSGTATFYVMLGGPDGQASNSSVTVNYATAGVTGGATSGSDFAAAAGTLTFAAGETLKTVVVNITDDLSNEGAERFHLNLSSPTGGAVIRDARGVATIGASDAVSVSQPRISVQDMIVDEAAGYVDIVVTMSAPGQNAVTVNYATGNASASYGSSNDFNYRAGKLVFEPGETTKVVRIEIQDDTTIESLEHFRLDLYSETNATIARDLPMISIVDNDSVVETPEVFVRDVIVDEKAGTATFHVMLGGTDGQASNSVVTVGYQTAGATATSGTDFAATSGSLVFAAGETVKTVVVDISDDTLAEGAERFHLDLTTATGATIRDGRGVATIGANDAVAVSLPRVSVQDMIVSEDAGYVDVVVSLSAPGQNIVSLSYATGNSTASYGSSSDFDYTSGTLTFAQGETTKVIRIELNDDTSTEYLEHFRLNLYSVTGATIADDAANIAIVDNDNVVEAPQIVVRDVVVDEKAGSATFYVMLGGPHGQSSNSPVTVNYATVADTAAAGSDFSATNGTLTFAPGASVQAVTVDINDDTSVEGSEYFGLNLTGATGGAVILDGRGVATINANDATAVSQPRISVKNSIVSEHDGYVDIVLSLSAPGQNPVSVTYQTQNNSASYGSNNDFVYDTGSVTFAAGQTTQVIRIELTEGGDTEGIESFFLALYSATGGAVIADPSTMISIVDNDNVVETPEIFVRDAVVDEAAGTATFVVMLGGPDGQSSNNVVSVNYATGTDGSAVAGSDFSAASGKLVFAVGETVKTVVVDLRNDTLSESLERINLVLSSPVNAVIRDGRGVAEIGANDKPAVALPILQVTNTQVSEADGYVDVVLTLSAPASGPASLSYQTSNSSAVSGDNNDFDYRTGTVSFAAGETTKVIRIEINDNPEVEGFESFFLNLYSASNLTIAASQTSIGIVDNDTPGQRVLSYGRSDDVYVVTASNDVIVENAGGGIDTVVSSATFVLGAELEHLSLSGSASIDGTGNAKANRITGNSGANELVGNAGADTINGGLGADTMTGGSGNDIYVVDNAGDIIVEGATVDVDSVQSSRTYSLAANLENLTLTGTQAISGGGNTKSNVLIGNGAVNRLSGGAGNDTIDGGAGADSLVGGTGNDTYYIDNAGDTITELNGVTDGIDSVFANRSFSLGLNLENLTLTSTGAYTGTGNAQANRITGNSAANRLDGGAGNDTLSGGAGADTMIGGTGDDTYVIADAGDVMTESTSSSGGSDTVLSYRTYSIALGLEHLTLMGTANISGAGNVGSNRLTGNAGVNTLTGGEGNDTLSGGLGADSMNGGNGNDTYVVENAGDVVTEGSGATSGIDTVQSSRSYTLGTNVENLTLTGTAAIGNGNASRNVLTGNNASNQLNGGSNNDTLNGGGGIDTLNGGTGADSMVGGAGSDTYYVDDAGDKVVELAGSAAGTADRVVSSISYSIASATAVESLTLTGTAITGTGNALSNRIIGNSATNVLTGGAGSDRVTGGAGADTFVFTSKTGSDVITDFDRSDDTFRFDQSGIRIGDGDATVDLGTATAASGGFAASRELVIFTSDIFGDIDSASAASMIGSATSSFSTGAQRLFVVDNGSESGIYLFTSSSANATVSASELTLIAMVEGETTTLADYTFVL